MTRRRRFTSRSEDAAFVLRAIEDARRPWKVGDRCLSYDLRSETSIVSIENDIVTLANGDRFHVTKVRRVR